jgi:hypothetical protein
MGQGSGTRRIDALVAGVACTVDVGPPELTAAVSQVLPGPVGPQDQPPTAALHLRVERADGRDDAEQDALQRGATRYVLYADGRAVTAPCDAAAVIRALDHHLRFQVSVLASDLLQVHAGVVVWQDRAIVLPAPSGSGKSTLVLALVRAGATFCSDDVAVVDAAGGVWSWSRAPRLRVPGDPDAREHPDVTPSGPGPWPVSAVVFSRYQPGATCRSRPIGPAATAAALLCNTPSAQARPAFALERCAALAACAPGFDLERGEADAAATLLLAIPGHDSPCSTVSTP